MPGAVPEKRVAIVTGANSGVGYAIVQRLVEECPDQPLVILLACRNKARAQEALDSLQDYFSSTPVSKRTWKHTPELKIELVDVGSVKSVLDFNTRILQHYPRIDFLFCNAGILPSVGLLWGKIVTDMFMAPMDLVRRSDVLIQPKQHLTEDGVGNVLACNVLGHYLMIRGLESVLEGPTPETPGRVIWTSSMTAEKDSFNPLDWQGLESAEPYESSKWVTDLVAIRLNEVWAGEKEEDSSRLSSGSSSSISESTPTTPVRRVTRSASKAVMETTAGNETSRRKNIISIATQPGVVASSIGGLAAWIVLLRVALHYFVRIMGERNQTITGYHGAKSNVHAAVAEVASPLPTSSSPIPTATPPKGLDYRFKYGSCVRNFGKEFLKVEHVVEYEQEQGKAILDELETLRQKFLKESSKSA
ncbi:hypothetical protein BGZ83_007902 [Gryganskiella cystojenkinii]|nr:hypothetical protein BGZ83_007902 [Gryganskiella cystojenkinii]